MKWTLMMISGFAQIKPTLALAYCLIFDLHSNVIIIFNNNAKMSLLFLLLYILFLVCLPTHCKLKVTHRFK